MRLTAVLASIVLALVIGGAQSPPSATQAAATVAIDADDIGGVVTSSKGPEAGVWVIAETTELPTKFARIVVTDDRGRYLIPDLPKANYDVWVRGYGLVDSKHVRAAAGKPLNLTAVIAPDPRAAAQYYPAGYWFSLMHVPEKSEFPGTGANGIAPGMKTQADWLRTMKSGTLPGVPRARHEDDPRDPRGARRDVSSRCLDAADQLRPGRRRHDAGHDLAGHGAGGRHVLRLDDSDREGRGPAGAAAAAGPRAQRRHHRVGLGGSQGVSARRGVDRSPQSAPQPERPDLRLDRVEHRLPAGARSRAQHHQPRAVDRPRSRDADDVAGDAGAVDELRQRAAVEQPQQRPQPDVRRAGPRLDHVDGPAGGRIPTSARPDRIIRRRSCIR